MGKNIEVYVTKYALTDGIFRLRCEIYDEGYACQILPHGNGHFLTKKEYTLTLDAALKNAEERRIKKLKSLDKQFKKISALNFAAEFVKSKK